MKGSRRTPRTGEAQGRARAAWEGETQGAGRPIASVGDGEGGWG